jgi:hypothetical protein
VVVRIDQRGSQHARSLSGRLPTHHQFPGRHRSRPSNRNTQHWLRPNARRRRSPGRRRSNYVRIQHGRPDAQTPSELFAPIAVSTFYAVKGGPLRVPPRGPARRAGRAASPGRPAAPARPRRRRVAPGQREETSHQSRAESSSLPTVPIATVAPRASTRRRYAIGYAAPRASARFFGVPCPTRRTGEN